MLSFKVNAPNGIKDIFKKWKNEIEGMNLWDEGVWVINIVRVVIIKGWQMSDKTWDEIRLE